MNPRKAFEKAVKAAINRHSLDNMFTEYFGAIESAYETAYEAQDVETMELLVSSLGGARTKAWRLQDRIKDSVSYIRSQRAKSSVPTFKLTPRDLELYSDMTGVGTAAREISSGLNRAVKELNKYVRSVEDYDEKKLGRILGKVYEKHVAPLMKKHRSFGAKDTEPEYHAQQALIDFVKDYYGISGYTNLGDYM